MTPAAPVVLITGGSRGIGRALALEFAARKYRVAICHRDSEAGAQTVAEEARKRSGQDPVILKADVSVSAQVRDMFERFHRQCGRIDVLVNNAGISRDRTILKMSDEEWEDVIRTNLNGAFWCLRECAKIMSKQQDGAIINISSYVGARVTVGTANYSASKAGLVALTKSAALELGRFNIRVNAIMPGFHRTAIGAPVWERRSEELIHQHTLGRTTDMNELARFVAEIAAQKSASGQIYNFDSRIT